MQLTRSPLEDAAPNYGSLFAVTFRSLGATWAMVLPVLLVVYLPRMALVWFWDMPLYVKMAYTVVIGSVGEALVLRLGANRLLGGPPGFAAAWQAALPRLFAVMVVNLIENALGAALIYTCIGAVFAGAVLLPAIPIALLEPYGPFRAVQQSWRRTRPHWLALSLVTFTLLLLELGIGMPGGVVMGLAKGGAVHLPSHVANGIRVFSEALILGFRVVSWPLELVAWVATLQRPLFTYGAAPDQAARL